jgi:hypothetical protein
MRPGLDLSFCGSIFEVAMTAVIEYYKLAAGVIPLIWVGNVLQQLSPAAARQAIDPHEDETAREWARLLAE